MEGWLSRRLDYLVARVGHRTLFLLASLAGILLCLVFGLAGIVRSLDAWLLLPFALLGLSAAWMLARSRLPALFAGPLLVVLGLGLVFGRVGRLGGPFTDLLFALNGLATDFIRWRPGLAVPDPSQLVAAWMPVRSDVSTLAARLAAWLGAMRGGRPGFDPAAIALVWGLAVWMAAAWMGWVMRRWRQPLPAIAPAVALLVFSLALTNGPTSFIPPILTGALVLVAATTYANRQMRWETGRIDYSEDIRLDLGLAVVAVTAVLTFAAALAPAFSLDRITDFLEALNRPPPSAANTSTDRAGSPPEPPPPFTTAAAGALGLQSAMTPTPPNVLIGLSTGGLPRDHLLGSGGELADIPVLRVTLPTLSEGESPPRLYWRALTYDRYTGRGWLTSATRLIEYGPNAWTLPARALYSAEAGSSWLEGQRLLEQEFEILNPDPGTEKVLFSAGELLAANQPYSVAWRRTPGTTYTSNPPPAGGDLFGATISSSTYRIQALLAAPGEAQLQSAGQDYPDWVLAAYLQVPDSLPARVRNLARDLTATEPTPFDRAKAIEAYLRTFPYNLQIPLPPRGRDLVDYFLYELQQGYCDYYATSMVMLSRSAGIPARMAMGFASGIYDPATRTFSVSAAQAHSWPEVYFPGYGWVAFEPTAGQPDLERPVGAQAYTLPPAEIETVNPWSFDWQPLFRSVVFLSAGVLVLLTLWLAFDWVRLRLLASPALLETLYSRLGRRASVMQVRRRPEDTPNEFAAALARRIRLLSDGGIWPRGLIQAGSEAERLIHIYTRGTYSPHPLTAADRRLALRLWQRLSIRLWLFRLLSLFYRPKRKTFGAHGSIDIFSGPL